MIAVFAVLGGRYSVGKELWRSEQARRLLPSVVWKFLATGRGQPFALSPGAASEQHILRAAAGVGIAVTGARPVSVDTVQSTAEHTRVTDTEETAPHEGRLRAFRGVFEGDGS